MTTNLRLYRPPVDTSVLTEAEIAAVKKEAAKQVDVERKKAVIKSYHEQVLAEERAKFDPKEEMEDILIDLPGYTTYMLINGVYYNHGTVANVPRHVGKSIREYMWNAWNHERVSGNPNMKDYKSVSQSNFSAARVGSASFSRA